MSQPENERSPESEQLQRARNRRIKLKDAMADLEYEAARPGETDVWLGGVDAAAEQLGIALEAHAKDVESSDGLLNQIRSDSPHLDSEILAIAAEHAELRRALTRVRQALNSRDVERVRRRVTSLLGRLTMHRQRGSDLVYEAYNVDIAASD